MKLGALVLLLAVAADQFNLYQSAMVNNSAVVDHHLCPMYICGNLYSHLEASFNHSVFSMCSGVNNHDCVSVVAPQDDRLSAEVLFENTVPGSVIHQALPNITSTSHCKIRVELKDEANTTHLVVVVYNFGQQSVMQFVTTNLFNDTVLRITFVKSTLRLSKSFSLSDKDNGVILDVGSCIFSSWKRRTVWHWY